MGTKQIVGLLIAVVAIVGAILYLGNGKARPSAFAGPAQEIILPIAGDSMAYASTTLGGDSMATDRADGSRVAAKSARYARAKELVAPAGFINTGGKPIKIADYVGKKVILLDIMTYSCINCIRTFPYVTDWYAKYEDKGLVVIGIHTPEFEFEKSIDNVTAAMQKYGVKFPVVLDNDYGTWTAYNNMYWPRKYLIDIDGFIRYDHIGEGGYAETEKVIRDLLRERAEVLDQKVDLDVSVTKGQSEGGSIGQSPETYIGGARNALLANGEPGTSGVQDLVVPRELSTSRLYLGGSWNIQPEHAESVGAGSSIVYPFIAKKVFLVMSSDIAMDVEVLVDGKPVAASDRGEDVRAFGNRSVVTVSESRLYSLYAGAASGRHTITLIAPGKGLRAFAFTFGG
ncbi:MAG TPA: redoxin domain-containing protein [Candidatus Paceibacterota bacterium]